MNPRLVRFYSLGVGLLGIGSLIVVSLRAPLADQALPIIFFSAFSLIIKRMGFHVFDDAGRSTTPDPRGQLADTTHWLGGMVDLAALLIYGSLAGAWVAVLSSFLYLMFRRPHWTWHFPPRRQTAIFNAGLKALMAFGSGAVYDALGGIHPPIEITARLALPLIALYLTWFSLDHLGWIVRVGLSGGRTRLTIFLRQIMLPSLLAELAPLPVSLLIAAVYTRLHGVIFALLTVTLVVISFVVQRLTEAQARLHARVTELTLVTELGQEIQSAQMDVAALCDLAYRYAGRVIDASNFALELFDEETNAVRRAVWVVNGERRAPEGMPSAAAMAWMRANPHPALVRDRPRAALPFSPLCDDSAHCGLYLPLLVTGDLIGLMAIECRQALAFTDDHLRALTAIASSLAVAIEGVWLHEQDLERERMHRELKVARGIQASLLPEYPPEIAGWEIAAYWQPALIVAGDFYDFVPLSDGRWGVLIADVSDKGVPAALFMALARTLIRTMAIDKEAPARALERASDLIVADARADMFVTAFYAVLTPGEGKVVYTNAGHLPPVTYCCGMSDVTTLHKGGIALGAITGIRLPQHELTLDPGAFIVMFTDGITEAANRAQEEFGEARLAQVVAEHAEASAEQLVQIIAGALRDFVGDEPTFDDQALVVAKYRGQP
jgi:sigma-B regulation protein RsbU (phosphoserine phosphatase)